MFRGVEACRTHCACLPLGDKALGQQEGPVLEVRTLGFGSQLHY